MPDSGDGVVAGGSEIPSNILTYADGHKDLFHIWI